MAQPAIMREFFVQALQIRGQVVKLYHKPVVLDCPCYNSIYQSVDPNCKECHGTGKIGGYEMEPAAVFVAAVFVDPEVRQDQHQELLTRVGPLQTMDGRMYCEAKWFMVIRIRDVINFKTLHESEGVEMQVISKNPRLGTSGEIIYVRCDLEKQPSRLVTNATDVKPLI